MSWSIYITDPDGYEIWLREGIEIGTGKIARFTKKEAEAQVKFMKIGMTRGEDYDDMYIVPTPTGLEEALFLANAAIASNDKPQ